MILIVRGNYELDGQTHELLVSSHPWSDSVLGQAMPRVPAGSDPEFRSAISWPQHGQRASLSFGSVDIINIDGRFDYLMNARVAGERWDLRVAADRSTPWGDTSAHFRAVVERIEFVGERLVRVIFRNPAKRLQDPIQIHFFPDWTPNEDLRGQRIPMIVGIPEHIPALLYDSVGTDEELWFVADGYDRSWEGGTGTIAAVNEGLAEIAEGGAAGQFEYEDDGQIRIHKHATLPVTVGWARGPRKRLIPWPDAHLTEWASGPNGDVPGGSWAVGGQNSGTLELKRFGTTESFELLLDEGIGSFIILRLGEDLLEVGADYILRIWTSQEGGGWSNRSRCRVVATFPGQGATTVRSVENIDWAHGPQDLAFTNSGSAAQTHLRIDWSQHPDDVTAGQPSRVRVRRIQLLRVEDPSAVWDVPATARRADEIVPYLLLERGVRVDSALEAGPLHPSEISYSDLETLSTDYPPVLGWYWQDATTHEQLLDRIAHTYGAAWGFDRNGVLRFYRAGLPDSKGGATPLQIADYNRTTQLKVADDQAGRLSQWLAFRRNFRPLSEGDVALTVSQSLRQRYGREWIQTVAASNTVVDALDPAYSHARSAEPLESMAVSTSGTAGVVTDLIELYDQRRHFYTIEAVNRDGFETVPGDELELTSHRFGIDEQGRLMAALDVRHLPTTNRLQITAWS